MLNPNPEDREIYPYVTCATDKENISWTIRFPQSVPDCKTNVSHLCDLM